MRKVFHPSKKFTLSLFCCLAVVRVGQSYHEGGDETICWKTDLTVANSAAVRLSDCPEGMDIILEEFPEKEKLLPDTPYVVKYTFTVPLELIPHQSSGNDIPPTNVHSCSLNSGFCTPFVQNTPGLSTHTPALKGDFTETATIRASSFETSFELPEGYYTVIIHGRVFAEDGLTKYDVAKGKKKTIEKPTAEDETLIKKSAIFIGIGASIVTLVSTISLYRKRAKAAQMQQDVANMQKEQTEVLKLLAATADAAMSTGNAVKSEEGHQGRRDTVQLEKDLDALQKEVCIRKERKEAKEKSVGGAKISPV